MFMLITCLQITGSNLVYLKPWAVDILVVEILAPAFQLSLKIETGAFLGFKS